MDTSFIQMSRRDRMRAVAREMGIQGCPVNKETFVAALEASVREETAYLESVLSAQECETVRSEFRVQQECVFVMRLLPIATPRMDGTTAKHWEFQPTWEIDDENDFWSASNPPLMNLPDAAYNTFLGPRLNIKHGLLYQAALLSGDEAFEYIEHYRAGGDLYTLIAKKLGVARNVAKTLMYSEAYSLPEEGVSSAPSFREVIPWVSRIPELIEQARLALAGVIRDAVLDVHDKTQKVPHYVDYEFVIGPSEVVAEMMRLLGTWGYHVEHDNGWHPQARHRHMRRLSTNLE